MRYIIYSRVSTDKQICENQIQECLKYVDSVKQEGDEVLNFEEPETSSRIPMDKRVFLKEMLDTVVKGDTVIVYKLDRLARDGEELVYIYRSKLIKKGIKIVSLYEPHIDNANIHIYAFLGETERNNIRIRTISGLKRKQKNGEKTGQCPYGYKTDPKKIQTYKQDCHSYGKPYLLIPCSQEQKIMKIIQKLHGSGLNYREIAYTLNEQGFKNRKGKDFHKMSVWQILHKRKDQVQFAEA